MLIVDREARHVAVSDDVRAVLVVAGVGDRQADLVQAGRPGEELLALGLGETPLRRGLLETPERGSLDARGVLGLDVIALAEPADRQVADVLVTDAPEQIVEQPFAK